MDLSMSDNKVEELRNFLEGKPSEEGEKIFNEWFDYSEKGKEGLNSSLAYLQKEIYKIKNKRKPAKGLSITTWRIAASIALFIIVSSMFYFSEQVLNLIDPNIYVEKQTLRGQRTKLDLSDGTQVWLNAESKLSFPERFKRGNREVYLEGEAFFDVARNPDRPFIIHTNKMTTKVLGTSFNVKAYPFENKQEVSVLTGNVSVNSTLTKQTVTVTLGQKALYEVMGSRSMLTSMSIPISEISAWRNQQLVFDDTPVSEVIETMSRYYNIKIKLKEKSLGACKISAKFNQATSKESIDLLCKILSATYLDQGEGFLISGPGCK
jgi:transmembrane sensor